MLFNHFFASFDDFSFAQQKLHGVCLQRQGRAYEVILEASFYCQNLDRYIKFPSNCAAIRLQNADMKDDMPGDTQALSLLPPVTVFLHWKLPPSEVTQ